MQKCKHKVRFVETLDIKGSYQRHYNEWRIAGGCILCVEMWKDDDIKSGLLQTYTQEIAELIFTAFESKRTYLKAVSELSANGIITTLSPKVANNE